MTDNRIDPTDPDRRGMMLGEAIDGAVRKITTAIVIAGAVVGLAVYARPGPARFDAFAFGTGSFGSTGAPARSSPAKGSRPAS